MKIINEFYLRPESLDSDYPDRKDVYATEVEAVTNNPCHSKKYAYRAVMTAAQYAELVAYYGIEGLQQLDRTAAYAVIKRDIERDLGI